MNTYLRECIDAVKSVDLPTLAATPLGEEIGWESGSESDFHVLGQHVVSDAMQWIGIKGPRQQSSDSVLRLQMEVKFIGQCVEKSPDLRLLVPSFIGIISVEGTGIKALITEDASCGNTVEVWSTPTSSNSRNLIEAAFSDFGEGFGLQRSELDRTMAFDVDGQERLLDFTPPPVLYLAGNAPNSYLELHEDIRDAIQDLTISLPHDSTLGQDLRRQYTDLPQF